MTRFRISYCPHKILLALATGQVDIHSLVRATYSSLCVKSCYVFIVHQNLGCICSFGLIYIVFSNTFGTSIQLKKNPLTFSYRYRPWNVLLSHLKREWKPSERWLHAEQIWWALINSERTQNTNGSQSESCTLNAMLMQDERFIQSA